MSSVVSQFEAACAQAEASGGAVAVLPTVADGLALAEEMKKLALSDLPRALRLTEHMVRAEPEDASLRVQWLAARAHVLCYANQFDEAVRVLGEAAEQAAGSDRELGQVMLASVQALARLGRLEEADEAAFRAFCAYEACGDRTAQGKAALNRGIVLRMRGKLIEAIESFDRASDLVGHDAFLSGALRSNRAEVLLDLDRFAEAELAMRQAGAMFSQGGNAHAAAIVQGNLGDLLSREGRIDEALESFERAKALFESAGAAGDVARLEAEMAEALCAIGAWDDAMQSYVSALPRLESGGLKREVARSRLGLGQALRARGDRHAAQQSLEQALTELEAVDADDLAADCRVALAQVKIGEGDTEGASHLLDAALTQLADRPARRARAHAETAETLLACGDAVGASLHAESAGQIEAAQQLLPLRTRLLRLDGRLALYRGQQERGRELLQAAMREADRLRGSLRVESFRLACGESWRDLYMDVCAAALDADSQSRQSLSTVFEALERVRSRTLLEALGSGADAGGAERLRGLGDHEQRLAQCVDELNVLYNRLGLSRGDEASVLARLSALETEADALRHRVEAIQTRGALASEPLSLDEACSRMPADTAALVYWEDVAGISVLIVAASGARVCRHVVGADRIASLLRRQRFCLERLQRGEAGTDAIEAWNAIGVSLAQALVAPIEPMVASVARVAISAFGVLEDVPWSVVFGCGGGSCSGLELLQIPGVSAALRIGPEQVCTSDGVLSVGVADDVAPLMEREALEVAQTSAGAQCLVGEDANAGAVLGALAGADVVHLSTHCVYSDRHPLSSRLRCADRWVTARELASAIKPGARVVLAGCESGRSGGLSSEDRRGLIRALLGAGASSVLASRWPLHDEAALRLMVGVHECRRGGSDLAASLAKVRRGSSGDMVPPWIHGGLFVTGGM